MIDPLIDLDVGAWLFSLTFPQSKIKLHLIFSNDMFFLILLHGRLDYVMYVAIESARV